ncbi:MAG: DUF58 domain-containing protein [Proteobacteria bacterium]|nr:MAG: DUF58 domain-containing protein [Pseudomonadota bacterium]
MMVPRIILIGISGLILFPAAYWLNHGSGNPWPAIAATLVWGAVTIADAVIGRGRIRTLEIAAAPVVRMTAERPGRIDLTIRKPAAMKGPLRLGLALPPAFISDHPDLTIHTRDGKKAYGVSWPCTTSQRGRFPLIRCHMERRSPLGLWALRRRFELSSELRVYPNLTDGRHGLAGLFRRNEWGLHTQRRLGKGREFEQLRDYLPGDSFEDIDWKATARRRRPVTRVFQVEQAQEIYVILDASRLSTRPAAYLTERREKQRKSESITGRSPADRTKPDRATIIDRYVVAALAMAVVAEQQSDRYGLLVFSDKTDCFIRAGQGHAHYNACREVLYDRRASLVSPDFDELFTFIGTHIRKRALMVFLTSLDDPMLADSFEHSLSSTARRHMVMINMFRPPGAYPLFSSADVHSPRGIYQHLAGHTLWESLIETRRRIRRHGAGFELLDQARLSSQLVQQYLNIKQRQVL